MKSLAEHIITLTNAKEISGSKSVQSLWSGYGEIRRYFLVKGLYKSIIVKHIKWPLEVDHPRGWASSNSHRRKLKSYQVEKNWYQQFASKVTKQAKIPELLDCIEQQEELFLIMEDLNATGYTAGLSPENVGLLEVKQCLSWLASFHAFFMQQKPINLWETGSYWHLETRPDEYDNMQNTSLKSFAKAIDKKLTQAQFQTIIHGDAKLANFCFHPLDREVAAVDFQYVGGGCGMKDVAYLISSCFTEVACEMHEEELLNHYFLALRKQVNSSIDFLALQEEWTHLYAFAWADFYRFLDGWSPGHWKMHPYSEKMVSEAIASL